MRKSIIKVNVTTAYGQIPCKAATNVDSPYFLSGLLLGNKIYNAVENGDTVTVEGYGEFKIKKTEPTFLESGKVYLILN